MNKEIRQTYSFVDLFKVGKLNYIKKDLRSYL